MNDIKEATKVTVAPSQLDAYSAPSLTIKAIKDVSHAVELNE